MFDDKNVSEETTAQEFDYSQFKGEGLEQAPVQAIPEFKILQPQSPEIMDKGNVLFGSTPGLIYNRFSKETMERLDFLPCYIRQMFSVYAGYKNTKREFLYSTFDRPMGYSFDKDKGMFDAHNHSFENSVVFLGIRLDGEKGQEPIFLKLSGTSRPVAMAWLKVMHAPLEAIKGFQAYVPPSYSRIFSLESKAQTNEGVSWFIWRISPEFTWVSPKSDLFRDAQLSVIQLRKFFSDNLISQQTAPAGEITSDDMPF